MKKLFRAAALVLLAALFLSGTAAGEAKYKPGVYEVVTRGMDGKIYFEIEFSEDAIVDIRVTKHHETEGLGDVALQKVIPAIIEAQSTDVDGKSGATITSNAIKKAVEEAIAMASAPADEKADEKPEEEPAIPAAKYVPGVYEVVTRGMDGKIYFEIEFSENAIVDIRVTKHHETEGLGDVALQKVIPAIVEAQSTDVDGKSGATITSNAIKKAVEEAIAMAAVPAEKPMEAEVPAAEAKYVPGVYEVVTRGMDGKIYFEIEFSEDAIVDIRVTKHHETEGLGDVALQKVIPAIIEAQSVEVDGKSGATITSNAIKKAVTEAIGLASAAGQ